MIIIISQGIPWVSTFGTNFVGFINPGSPMDPLPCKTRPSRRRSDNAGLGRPRYIMIGRDNDLVPDRKAWPRWDRSPTPTPFLRSRICQTFARFSFPTDTVEADWERPTRKPAWCRPGEQAEQIR